MILKKRVVWNLSKEIMFQYFAGIMTDLIILSVLSNIKSFNYEIISIHLIVIMIYYISIIITEFTFLSLSISRIYKSSLCPCYINVIHYSYWDRSVFHFDIILWFFLIIIILEPLNSDIANPFEIKFKVDWLLSSF